MKAGNLRIIEEWTGHLLLGLLAALLALAGLLALTSCGSVLQSYTVDGSGLDWVAEPVQTLSYERVTPNLTVPMPKELGGGEITLPVTVEKSTK